MKDGAAQRSSMQEGKLNDAVSVWETRGAQLILGLRAFRNNTVIQNEYQKL